jgi:hypothetical protein
VTRLRNKVLSDALLLRRERIGSVGGQDVCHPFPSWREGISAARPYPDRVCFQIRRLGEPSFLALEFEGVGCAEEVTVDGTDLIDQLESESVLSDGQPIYETPKANRSRGHHFRANPLSIVASPMIQQSTHGWAGGQVRTSCETRAMGTASHGPLGPRETQGPGESGESRPTQRVRWQQRGLPAGQAEPQRETT